MNPDLIRWARETAGLDLDEAARVLDLSSSERLARIESGDDVPSRPLLLKMCKAYRRPLLTFYLATPPRQAPRGQDFRTLPRDHPLVGDALLDALVRDVMARQDMVRAIVQDEEDGQPLPFVASAAMSDGVAALRGSVITQLGLNLADYRARPGVEQAFAYLREKAEAQGIYVLLIGNLGSHHSAISVETFRGFAIADPIAPFIVINDQDAKAAWSFTLLHELAHIWLGQTGVSGNSEELAIERFCNEVASGFLLPPSELDALALPADLADKRWLDRLGEFANARRISRRLVAYALLRTGRITRPSWQQIDQALHQRWLAERDRRRRAAKGQDSGPSYYVVRQHRLGKALLNLVDRTMSAGALTPVKAAILLGVKPRVVHPLLLAGSTATITR
jgi:Zn-dependent peptidase ImmA (M78 family)/transcriptional regulator with XRE-family HTH domain